MAFMFWSKILKFIIWFIFSINKTIWSIVSNTAIFKIKKLLDGILPSSDLKLYKLEDKSVDLKEYKKFVPIKSSVISYDPLFREEIICPICLEIPIPPIYICNIGHHVCKNCRWKIYLCPKCRAPYSKFNSRNFFLEHFILNSNHECPFKSLGCQICPLGELLEEHKNNCEYMVLSCPLKGYSNCNEESLKISEIKQHLYNLHSEFIHKCQNSFRIIMPVPSELEILSLDDLTYTPNIIDFNGNIFVMEIRIHFPSQYLIYFSINRLSKIIENKNYGFKFKIKGKSSKIQWKTEILHSINSSDSFTCNIFDFCRKLPIYNSTKGKYEFTIEHEFYEIVNCKKILQIS